MKFQRITTRRLPNGETSTVFPFHVCMEGVENGIICTDEQDYDLMVKVSAIAAHRFNVIVITYAVVSNHLHIAILAKDREDSEMFGNELKRIWSMWTNRKYSRKKELLQCNVSSIYLSSDWYLRNALAYILRNALDNGAEINSYKWSSYSAYFNETDTTHTKVSTLTKREREVIFHTHLDLRKTSWLLDSDNHLLPRSFCDYGYLEDAFGNSQAFFMKTIGGVNSSEMQQKLVDSPRTFQYDSEFYKTVNDIVISWFNISVSNLAIEKKARLLPYLYHNYRTSVPQLARVMELTKEEVVRMLHVKYVDRRKK